jgi:1,4-alpha-glucan branching enzyme
VKEDGTIIYREWAPNALQASLIGDFSEFYGPRSPKTPSHNF